jgi:hypothetical protein
VFKPAELVPGCAWAIVEMNATDLKAPMVQPYFARSYHAFRDMFNFDAREVSAMAWNGSNGLYAGQPGYLPYIAWRNTPAEAAMRDFMVTHANLPLGARLWSFGAPGYLDDDGWHPRRQPVIEQSMRGERQRDANNGQGYSASGTTALAISVPSQLVGF